MRIFFQPRSGEDGNTDAPDNGESVLRRKHVTFRECPGQPRKNLTGIWEVGAWQHAWRAQGKGDIQGGKNTRYLTGTGSSHSHSLPLHFRGSENCSAGNWQATRVLDWPWPRLRRRPTSDSPSSNRIFAIRDPWMARIQERNNDARGR